MPNNPTNYRRSFWDTRRGASQLNAAHARLLGTLCAPESSSSSRSRAWAQYRQERFTETGLEGQTGTGAVYHWRTDYARPLGAAVRALTDDYLVVRWPPTAAVVGAIGHAYVHGAEIKVALVVLLPWLVEPVEDMRRTCIDLDANRMACRCVLVGQLHAGLGRRHVVFLAQYHQDRSW